MQAFLDLVKRRRDHHRQLLDWDLAFVDLLSIGINVPSIQIVGPDTSSWAGADDVGI
jgi:hypothetical protein